MHLLVWIIMVSPLLFTIGSAVRIWRRKISKEKLGNLWWIIFLVLACLTFIIGLGFATGYCPSSYCRDAFSNASFQMGVSGLYFLMGLLVTIIGFILSKKVNLLHLYFFIIGSLLVYLPFAMALIVFG